MALLGASTALLFGWAIRQFPTKEEVYAFNLYYDALVFFVYYALPLLLMGVKPSPGAILGTVILLAGIILIKVNS